MINPNDPAFPISNDKLREAEIGPYGLTKREFIATKMDGVPNDSSSRRIAEMLGIPKPPQANIGDLSAEIEVGRWWIRADAAWKVMQADALIAELNKEVKS